MNAHPGTLLSALGVVVLLAGLAAEANALILIGLVVAIVGAFIGGARRSQE
jgi:hypothetical protein